MKRAGVLLEIGVVLTMALISECGAQPSDVAANRFNKGPKPGTPAPDFELKTVEGKSIRASVLWSNKPDLIMTGSHTCPVFRGKVDGFEGLVRDFSNEVNFVVRYTIEAHTKGDPSPYSGREWVTQQNEKIGLLIAQPKTMEEREQRARTCVKECKLTVPVVVDEMDN